MIRLCSWCQTIMGQKEPLDDKQVTHGICPECQEELAEEARVFYAQIRSLRIIENQEVVT